MTRRERLRAAFARLADEVADILDLPAEEAHDEKEPVRVTDLDRQRVRQMLERKGRL